MSAGHAERHPVDRLAEEFVDRYRRGERPAISDYTQKYPELAGELQEILAALVLIEEHGRAQVKPGFDSGSEPLSDRPAPVQLGEYRVLREIGRGGMGVVYEAVQESLGRHVALKVLPTHALLDGVRLKRFQHEAQAAARLHHTNIVPIFGVGTAEGVHFYAMQFIQGRGLDEVIGELRQLKSADRASAAPSASDSGAASGQAATTARASLSTMSDTPRYYRSVANLGAQVAEALDHAHRQGVTHRDIKPSNLLLDAAGTVWITDFGLAKADGTEELTHPGDLVGTLRYMAPEQLRGKGDARADIYSLGSTLYELLTLRPAFDAPDRAALVRQIVQDEPQRPRKLDARIPRDLETVVLKAMAQDPESRYATASELAADLRRFLDDKPIAARPVGVHERLWRWCVRRPALASLAAALLLSLVVGMAGVLWQWGRAETNFQRAVRQERIAVNMLDLARQEQRRAEQNLAEAARQRTIARQEAAEAEAGYQTARDAVNELLTIVSENELLAQPGLQPVRLQLLTRALEFHEQRLASRDQDPVARRDLATSYLRLGTIKQQLGPTNEAADAYRRAIALLTPIEDKGDGDRATTILLARVEIMLGWDHIHRHELTAGRAMLNQARERLERLLAVTPNDRSAQTTLAVVFNNLGFLQSESVEIPRTKRFEEALELHGQSLAIFRRLADGNPKNQTLRLDVSSVLSNMARRHASLARYGDARALLEECLKIRQELLRRQPGSLQFQSAVGATLNALGDVIRDSDLAPAERLREAVDHYQQSLEIQERLVRENPAVLAYRQDLGNTVDNIADLHFRNGDVERALEWRRRGIAVWDACLTLDPANDDVRAHRAVKINGQATCEEKLGLYAEALNSRLRAHEAWHEIQKHPAQLAVQRANILLNLTDLMIELGKQDRVSELCALVNERRELAGDKPGDLLALSYDLERAFRAVRRGAILEEDQAANTAEYQRLAVELFREAAEKAPREAQRFVRAQENMKPYYRLIELDATIASHPDDASALISRARWLQQLDDLVACQQDREQALLLLGARLDKMPNDPALLKDRAWLYLDEERWDDVVEDITAALVQQPNDLLLMRLRAWANMRLEHWQPAYDDFTAMLDISPDQILYWPDRCRAAAKLGLESRAVADANRLVELTEQYPTYADSLVTEFMLRHSIDRFPEATLALARHAVQRHPNDNVVRGELGGVQFYLAQYREAIENLQPAAAEGPSESSALAGFWLAISYSHLGEPDKAKAEFIRAVRNWKAIAALPPDEEELLRSLWQEASALVAGDAPRREALVE
jgi:serine/threonine protein kinase/Tfp pilus assembly protein PilF/regulator of sirC expression with transglutaminase-like and TPR domain